MGAATKRGFTLVELMIVVAIIAIVSSVAIPKFMSSRVSTNENAAIGTLRTIAAAQQQLQASCAVDTDADGRGEFGFFGELAGSAPLRIIDGATALPTIDGNNQTLDPPILPTGFGETVLVNGEAVVRRSGYFFKIYLPDATAALDVPGIGETGPDGIGGATIGNIPNSSNAEQLWCCYAWPIEAESSGNRAFFIDQVGEVLQTPNNAGGGNTAQHYDGTTQIPTYDAAYSTMAGDPRPNPMTGMRADLGITSLGQVSNDGNLWTVVGGS